MNRTLSFAFVLMFATVSWAGSDMPVERPGYLGLVYTPHKATVDGSSWLKVVDVIIGSPAEKAGIRGGDLIVAIGGKPVQFRNRLDIVKTLAEMRSEKVYSVTVIRARERHTIEIVHSWMPDQQYQQWKAYVERLRADLERGSVVRPK